MKVKLVAHEASRKQLAAPAASCMMEVWLGHGYERAALARPAGCSRRATRVRPAVRSRRAARARPADSSVQRFGN
ncbi:hypothetical protein Dimus_031740, partial [Dionaea muscipula]